MRVPMLKPLTASKILFVLIVCLFPPFIQAQEPLSFEHFRITEGLSQSTVNCIVEDQQKQLWLGTQEGLNRFDGKEFVVYNRENTPSILSDYVFCASSDSQGFMWFGTRKGVLYFNPTTELFTSFPFTGSSSNAIHQLAQHNSQTMLCLTENGELLRFALGNSLKQKKFKALFSSKTFKKIIKTPSATLLVGQDNVLYELDVRFKLSVWKKKFVSIESVFYINHQLVVFSKDKAYTVSLINKKSHRIFTDIQSSWDQVTGLHFYQGNHFITTAQKGLFVLNEQGDGQHYEADLFRSEALNSNNLNTLFVSSNHELWIGSDRGLSGALINATGVYTGRPSGNLSQGLPTENVWSFLTDHNQLLIGTDVGISIQNQKTKSFKHYSRSFLDPLRSEGSVMDIEHLKGNLYLLACYDGIFTFNAQRNNPFTSIPLPRDLLSKYRHFYKVFPLGKSFLIGTTNGVLLVDPEKKKFKEINANLNDPVREIISDKQGRIWVLFEKKGLYQFQSNKGNFNLKPFRFNAQIKALSTEALTTLVEVKPHVFMIGTMGSGIIQMNVNNGNCTLIDKTDGLPNNTINGLLKDQKGNIWTSTNRGMVCLNENGSINTSINRYGLETNEYNMNASYSDIQGNLYFGGIFGFHAFNPMKLTSFEGGLFPLITKVKLHKHIQKYPQGFISKKSLEKNAYEVELPYSARDFEIWFQPNRLQGAQHISYKYIIIGEETDTISLGNLNHLSLTSLAAGTYYIRLYCRYENGPWTSTPALLTVVILPPIWATTSFWLVMAVMLVLMTIFYVKWKVNQERNRRIKLEYIVTKRTQEIILQKEEIELKNHEINLEKEKVLEQQKLLFIEKERAEKWLNNALPSQAVKELKMHGKVPAKAYDAATILFTDVVSFTKISESTTPSRLVNKLDILFKKFDQIIKDNNLEKIKTIGDAYMAVGGIPDANSTHAIDACIAGLQIQNYMRTKKFDALANHKDFWEIRIGINSGPVTAGIIGSLKMAYDVWGSAVNQAQRMEMLAQPGSVTVSEHTFKIIEPYFECIYKGKAQMKTKVLMNMYEVIRIKTELSLQSEGLKPNDLFYEIVGLHHYSSIKYYNAENEVLMLLEEKLPKDLTYHSLNHTKDVVKAVERIALLEGVRDEGLFLLKSAALFHDAGFIEQYEHNEPIGAALAEKMLPKYGYNEQHIKTIVALIYSTQIPHKPVNKLQEIMCDADLDYLGTDTFDDISDQLKIELMAKGKIHSEKQWDEIQVSFLNQHRYFTQTSIQTREPKKKENIAKVNQRLEENNYD